MKKTLITLMTLMGLLVLTAVCANANMSEYINITSTTAGEYDIYQVPKTVPSGYRYGPCFIVNEDGTIDAWFASGGSGIEQWDWIMYKHYDGTSWSEEKCVLQPTPNGFDHYSCCDPGVIYLKGYYYLAYTATMNFSQTDNALFVARSENPDGPYEKWNGNGWGGIDPKPIVSFSEDSSYWGIGEASMTELNGTLYIYYTESGAKGHCTAVATADAASENWPATMEFQGYALENTTSDAIDVKYIDEYQKFVAVASEKRMSQESYLVFYESNDGLRFRISDICKKNVLAYCHNPGLSGNKNGHITKDMECFVAYAYGKGWGVWNTRVMPISFSLGKSADLNEIYAKARDYSDISRDTRDPSTLEITGISPQSECVISASDSTKKITLWLTYCNAFRNTWKSLAPYSDEIEMYGYDESIIKRKGSSMEFEVLAPGKTMVTVEFRGHLTYVYVCIYDTSTMDGIDAMHHVGTDIYNLTLPLDGYAPQIKTLVKYKDGYLDYFDENEYSTVLYEYDTSALDIDKEGRITPKKEGSYKVKVICEDHSYEVTVNIFPRYEEYAGFPDVSKESWYYSGVKYCYENRYIEGTDKGTFAPDNILTREQFVLILARVSGAKLSRYSVSPFTDVDAKSWYGPAVIWAAEGGYVQGIGEGKFGVGKAITREELAVLLYRYSLDTNSYPLKIYTFTDWGNVSSWAVNALSWAINKGILGSTSSNKQILSPKMTVTRAQAAKIFTTYDQVY